jgi:hypothetical protein
LALPLISPILVSSNDTYRRRQYATQLRNVSIKIVATLGKRLGEGYLEVAQEIVSAGKLGRHRVSHQLGCQPSSSSFPSGHQSAAHKSVTPRTMDDSFQTTVTLNLFEAASKELSKTSVVSVV